MKINKFIFFDEEDNYMIVEWDKDIFEQEYVKLQNEYWDNNLEWLNFYDELEGILSLRWVKLITDIALVRHKDLDFNK